MSHYKETSEVMPLGGAPILQHSPSAATSEHSCVEAQDSLDYKYLKTEDVPTDLEKKIEISKRLAGMDWEKFVEQMKKRKADLGIKDDDE